jgi:hypothetical protein
MGDQPGDPLRLVAVEPRIDGIRVAWLQEPGSGDAMGGLALGDLQDRRASLADLRTRVAVT